MQQGAPFAVQIRPRRISRPNRVRRKLAGVGLRGRGEVIVLHEPLDTGESAGDIEPGTRHRHASGERDLNLPAVELHRRQLAGIRVRPVDLQQQLQQRGTTCSSRAVAAEYDFGCWHGLVRRAGRGVQEREIRGEAVQQRCGKRVTRRKPVAHIEHSAPSFFCQAGSGWAVSRRVEEVHCAAVEVEECDF